MGLQYLLPSILPVLELFSLNCYFSVISGISVVRLYLTLKIYPVLWVYHITNSTTKTNGWLSILSTGTDLHVSFDFPHYREVGGYSEHPLVS